MNLSSDRRAAETSLMDNPAGRMLVRNFSRSRPITSACLSTDAAMRRVPGPLLVLIDIAAIRFTDHNRGNDYDHVPRKVENAMVGPGALGLHIQQRLRRGRELQVRQYRRHQNILS
jgi:hypothetical protein